MTDLLIVCHRYVPASTADAVRLAALVDAAPTSAAIEVLCTAPANGTAGELIHPIPGPRRWRRFWVFRALQELRQAFRYISILRKKPARTVLVSSPPYLCFLFVRLYLSRTGRRFVHDLRDPYPELLGTMGRLWAPLERYLARTAAFTTCCTEEMSMHYANRFGGRTETVPNGYDPQSGQAMAPAEVLRIAVLGNMGRFQDIPWLVHFIRTIGDVPVQFELIGSGTEEHLIRDHPAVRFHGRLSLSEARSVLRNCHVGLNLRAASLWNDLVAPVRTFEYIGAGLPQFMIPRTALFRKLEGMGLGWAFDHRQASEIRDLISVLLQDGAEWTRVAQRVQEEQVHFRRAVANEKWVQLLNL